MTHILKANKIPQQRLNDSATTIANATAAPAAAAAAAAVAATATPAELQ